MDKNSPWPARSSCSVPITPDQHRPASEPVSVSVSTSQKDIYSPAPTPDHERTLGISSPLKSTSTTRNHYHQIPDRKTVKIRLARNTLALPSPLSNHPLLINPSTNWSITPRLNQRTHQRTHQRTRARICFVFYLLQCRLSRIPLSFSTPFLCRPCIVRRTAIVRHMPLPLLLLFFFFLFFFSMCTSLIRLCVCV